MADPSAGWPHQNALELFDIATVCLRHKHKQRPGMDQVRGQLVYIVTGQSSYWLQSSYWSFFELPVGS